MRGPAPGECTITDDELSTFDDVVVTLPTPTTVPEANECKLLFAQDCSQRGLFSIVGAGSQETRVLMILVPGYHIELPRVDWPKVIVNGREKTVTESRTIHLREDPADERWVDRMLS